MREKIGQIAQCPTCKIDLRRTDYGEYGFVILDICPACEGAWFDKGELDRLDESVWTEVESLVQPSVRDVEPRGCPKCGTTLDSISLADVPDLVLDQCASCKGFWLDVGELEKVQDIAGHIDDEKLGHMRHYKKPEDWSYLRWAVYCYKTFK